MVLVREYWKAKKLRWTEGRHHHHFICFLSRQYSPQGEEHAQLFCFYWKPFEPHKGKCPIFAIWMAKRNADAACWCWNIDTSMWPLLASNVNDRAWEKGIGVWGDGLCIYTYITDKTTNNWWAVPWKRSCSLCVLSKKTALIMSTWRLRWIFRCLSISFEVYMRGILAMHIFLFNGKRSGKRKIKMCL